VTTIRNVAIALAGLSFGWALVTAAEHRAEPQVNYQVIVRTVTVEVEPEPEPAAVEAPMDVDAYERETECLWEFMQKHDLDMDEGMVWAATEATRQFGGACYLMGDD